MTCSKHHINFLIFPKHLEDSRHHDTNLAGSHSSSVLSHLIVHRHELAQAERFINKYEVENESVESVLIDYHLKKALVFTFGFAEFRLNFLEKRLLASRVGERAFLGC